MHYKIAFLLPHLESKGGVTTSVQTISNFLARQGHDVHLFSLGKTNMEDTKHIHTIPSKRKREQFKIMKKKFHLENEKRNFDLVVSNTIPTAYLLHHLHLKCKHVMILRQASLFQKKNLINTIKRRILFPILFNKKNIIMVSKCLEAEFLKAHPYVKPKNTRVIHNAYDLQKVEELANKQIQLPKEKYILSLGRHTKNKNLNMTLEAFKDIENKEIKLVLLGEGKQTNRLKRLTASLKLEDRIIFINWTHNPYPWIKNAQLVISTSKSEAFPRVHLESLALKTPIVSTDIKCGPNEILIDELKPFLVALDNITQLRKTINKALIAYPEILPKYRERFQIDCIAQAYIDIIEDEKWE